jgi:NAD(P)H-hydrate epimerase
MRNVLTASQMQEIDKLTAERVKMPTLILMSIAGYALANWVQQAFEPDDDVLIVCGEGNNGGDGIAMGYFLKQAGFSPTIAYVGDAQTMKEPAETFRKTALGSGMEIIPTPTDTALSRLITRVDPTVIVDALFGVGLDRPLSQKYVKLIAAMNEADAIRVAVDVPSGLDSTSGRVHGAIFKANVTLTLGWPKVGFYNSAVKDVVGDVVVLDIGFPQALLDEVSPQCHLFEERDFAPFLAPRPRHSNKGTYGKVLVVAGAVGTSGAAKLVAKSALRTGCGMVRAAVPESIYQAVAAGLESEMVIPLPATKSGGIAKCAVPRIVEEMKWADLLIIGSGLLSDPETLATAEQVLKACDIPCVVDADGLWALPDSWPKSKPPIVITPHAFEMGKVFGLSGKAALAEFISSPIGSVRDTSMARNFIIVFKSSSSFTAFPQGTLIFNPTGNPGMATAGSGDVLAGIIGGLWAQERGNILGIPAAVFLHGYAGDLAAQLMTETAMIASDIMNHIPVAISRLTEKLRRPVETRSDDSRD